MSNKLEKSAAEKLIGTKAIQDRFKELIGEKKAAVFVTSLLQVVKGNSRLQSANPQTIINAAATAAALDLPINQNLGFAWIVPYNSRQGVNAQFQIGWKGYVQLALRTNQYHRINAVTVYENQKPVFNALTEQFSADFSIEGEGNVAGYVAYFRLVNGFEKIVYWSKAKVQKHAEKYSKGFKSGSSTWNDGEEGFNAMGKKTVLSLLLRQYGIMSIEMQTAFAADHSVQPRPGQFDYIDNPKNKGLSLDEIEASKERNRLLDFIEKATNLEDLHKVQHLVSDHNLGGEYDEKVQLLMPSE